VTPGRVLALFAAKDIEALIDAAFPLLRTAVACDFTTALYRSAGKGLLNERDSRGREYDPAFMRRYAELTPALFPRPGQPGYQDPDHSDGPTAVRRGTASIRVLSRNHAATGLAPRCRAVFLG
jgi:hypothetical protein